LGGSKHARWRGGAGRIDRYRCPFAHDTPNRHSSGFATLDYALNNLLFDFNWTLRHFYALNLFH